MQNYQQPLRVGVGGPVGSGKTALCEMLCKSMRDRYEMAVITNDIYTKEDMEILMRAEALPATAILIAAAIGAGIVLVVGYLCWPGTWRPRLGEHIAAGVEALAGYARVAFGADRSLVGPARRRLAPAGWRGWPVSPARRHPRAGENP